MSMEKDQTKPVLESDEMELRDENDWKKVFWTDEDARVVGNFLRGEVVVVDESPEIFARLAESTDFFKEKEARNRQKKELKRIAAEKLEGIATEKGEEKEEPYGKIETEEEYGSVNRLMGRTILRMAIGSLVKRGVISAEAKTFLVGGELRKKEGGYVYDDWMGERPSEKETPEVTIKAPVYRTDGEEGSIVREFGNRRLRGSFAHEVDHEVRALSNRMLWKGVDRERAAVLKPVERLFVGGYRVGSNKQGSEGVGNLFSEVVKLKAASLETKIADLAGPVAAKLSDNLGKDKVEPRYRVALTALLDHLIQLKNLGYQDLPAEDLLALGMCGYGSLEKMPDLIRAGVMTREKYEKMKLVAKDVLGWLTSESETGYQLA